MLKRLLVLAAAVGSLAAPLSAQTIFRATGGDVTFEPTSFALVTPPFQVFVQALGGAQQLIMSDDGTSYSLLNLGTVANSSLGALGILHLGSFAAGTGLVFTYAINGASFNSVGFYLHKQGGYNVQFCDTTNGCANRLSLELRGITSAEGLQCPGGDRLAVCSDVIPGTPVTPTPEPGTWALMATGLAGLIPVVRRRRSVSPS